MNPKIQQNRAFKLILYLGISLLITLLSADKFFFWDTISQISIPANWYYDNDFRYFFLPDNLATGHPTFIGMYVALLWKLFGKSLLVSHLAMFPFIFGILYQLDSYLKNSDEGKIIPLLILVFVLCDATLLSQMSMVTFDIPQIYFFLWSINSLINKKYRSLSISFCFLVLTSLRGSICGIGVIGFSILTDLRNTRRFSFKSMVPFLPGLVALVLFLTIFFIEKQWIIHNVISNKWEQSARFVSFQGIMRNIGISAWRLIDYGRIGIWIILLFIIIISIRKKIIFGRFFSTTLSIALCQFVVLLPFVLFSGNPIGHRYFLPVIIFVTISVIYWILIYSKYKIFIYCVTSIIVLSGYFWIYPDTIAQGWDATPAHWSYYKARNEMLGYLRSKSIPPEKVGSFFPNLATFRLTDLNEDASAFKDADLEKDNFILFSNVYNLSDDKIDDLFSDKKWIMEKSIKNSGVSVILFRRISSNDGN